MAGDLEAAWWTRPVETARIVINLIRGHELERLPNPQLEDAEFQRRLHTALDHPTETD